MRFSGESSLEDDADGRFRSDLSSGDGFSGAIANDAWWTDANREIKSKPLDPSNSTEF